MSTTQRTPVEHFKELAKATRDLIQAERNLLDGYKEQAAEIRPKLVTDKQREEFERLHGNVVKANERVILLHEQELARYERLVDLGPLLRWKTPEKG